MKRFGGPTMGRFLEGLSGGRTWAWLLIVTLAAIALAILIGGLDGRKTRKGIGRDSDDPEARRWLDGLKAKKAKAGQGGRRGR